MINVGADAPATRAMMRVTDWAGPFAGPIEIEDTVGFSYSHDVLQLGDPFSVTIPDPKGRYSGRFQRGADVDLYLTHPKVNGGQKTRKHTGLIVRRVASSNLQGSHIQLECADRGWHLLNNDAPLWYKLQYAKLEKLIEDLVHPSWKIGDPVTSKEIDVLLRRGVNNSRAQAAIDLQALGTLTYIQAEPGDKVADLILTYCRRINVLVNIGCEGQLILFRPNYNQPPLYTINFHGFDDANKNLNSVLDVRVEEGIDPIYTITTCIGERVGDDLTADPRDQNNAKRAGTFRNDFALPFRRNLNFADSEIFTTDSAIKQAKWKYDRGVFDSWSATYTVRGHHQDGNWLEADTMCTVRDSVHGLDGNFYVQSVYCVRDEQGDRTQVTLRRPGLLQAAFGVMPRAPRIKMSPPVTGNTTTTTTTAPDGTTTVTVTTVTQPQ